jgi:hypothetical protein
MATALIAPAPEDLMEVYEVPPAVNRVANDGPALHEPYSANEAAPPTDLPAPRRRPTDTGQGSLF